MRLETPRTKRSEPDLTGLINVVFLILIFFIVAGSLRPYAARDLKLAKATAKGGEAVRSSHLIIAADGTIRYRGSDITLEALRARLREEAAGAGGTASGTPTAGSTAPSPSQVAPPQARCVVVADARADARIVLEVAEACGASKTGAVSLMAERKSPTSN
ncbi:MAG: biopolymer transporter ExbD [Hyphomicrobiaceae bacterium]|nr:biopolymer transporter ExbD [Hyphomicrobiaceae bacterium]